MSVNVRRLLATACFVLGAVWAAMFALVAVTKITALSPVAVLALLLYGASAATLLLAGRGLLRHQ